LVCWGFRSYVLGATASAVDVDDGDVVNVGATWVLHCRLNIMKMINYFEHLVHHFCESTPEAHSFIFACRVGVFFGQKTAKSMGSR